MSVDLAATSSVELETETALATVQSLRALFILMKSAGAHGVDHPVSQAALERAMSSLEAASPPLAVQFVVDGAFRDRQLLPLDTESYGEMLDITAALRNLQFHEIAVTKVTAEGVRTLAEALARGRQGPSDEYLDVRMNGLELREIEHAKRGIASERVEDEVFVATQFVGALETLERLLAVDSGGWPWSVGVSVLRRLERAGDKEPAVFHQCLEVAPGDWTVARRALAAVWRTQALLLQVDAPRRVARAFTQAQLVATACGLSVEGGLPFDQSVAMALTWLRASALGSRTGVDPHRMRTLAVLWAVSERRGETGAVRVWREILELNYEMERRRPLAGGDVGLSTSDLLSEAVRERSRSDVLLRLLIEQMGEIPAGLQVWVPGAGVGRVAGPGRAGETWRPQVYVEGRLLEPKNAVELIALEGPQA